jgi:hypothetical protein
MRKLAILSSGASVAALCHWLDFKSASFKRKRGKAENRVLTARQLEAGSLRELGVAVLPAALNKDHVAMCKSLPAYAATESFLGRMPEGRPGGVGRSNETIEGTPGRFHRFKFDAESLKSLDSLEVNWMPEVEAYLGPRENFYRSQLQVREQNKERMNTYETKRRVSNNRK